MSLKIFGRILGGLEVYLHRNFTYTCSRWSEWNHGHRCLATRWLPFFGIGINTDGYGQSENQ